MTDRDTLIAYLTTIVSIVLLALAAAAVCLFAKIDSEVNLARIIGGLGFISAAIAGLTGIAGTFRPGTGAKGRGPSGAPNDPLSVKDTNG